MTERKKVVLITGASGGIGRACIGLFAEQGWLVVGTDLSAYGSSFPPAGLFIQADLSDPLEFELLFKKTREFSPLLDAIVHNAGMQIAKPILETTLEDWDMTMAANLRPVFLGSKFAHPMLKASGAGAIVSVCSVHAVTTSANISAYAASKGGMLALTRAMAIEFAPDHIRANAVLPGAVDTPMLRASMQRGQFQETSLQDRLDALAKKTVNGRLGQPEEIARAVFFLADESQSSFMTGQALIVDGGATARLSTE